MPMLPSMNSAEGEHPVAAADEAEAGGGGDADPGERREQPLLAAGGVGQRAEDRRQHRDRGERDRRGDAEAERRGRVAEPVGGDLGVVDREHRGDDRGHERRVGPVVPGPGAQLGPVQAEAGQPRSRRRIGRRRRARPSVGPPRDPLAQQRVDDDVAAVRLARDQILPHQRGERRLHARRAAEAVAVARLGGEQLAGRARGRRRAAPRAGRA